ncbi:hypothetical protein PHYC_03718 [Phycisphaerales bacterium]|nr:hypothetical protein PHYC_03718 [Phycisphaerales bacterium]
MNDTTNQFGQGQDDSAVLVATDLDALACRERSLPNAAFESRVADTSFRHLIEARAQSQGLRIVGQPAAGTAWRFSAGFRLAAGLALAALVGAAMLGRGNMPRASERDRLVIATDSEWAMVFAESGTADLFTEAEQLSKAIRTWEVEDTLSNEGAM